MLTIEYNYLVSPYSKYKGNNKKCNNKKKRKNFGFLNE